MSQTDSENPPARSGAAGAQKFPDWDSRKYNYFEPKGRRATHYEDVTVDVQPDPKRYLLQDWIMSFPDGTPTYSESWTLVKCADWHLYRSVDQEWERTHYQRQSTVTGMIKNVTDNGRKSGAPLRFAPAWAGVLQDHVGAMKHAEFGIGTAMMHAQRHGYTQMINNVILTNASYKLRFAQDLTLYLAEIGMDIGNFDNAAGKRQWLDDPIWQGVRRLVEEIDGASDPLEQYFAANFLFEPLVGELFRGGFVMQAAATQNDFMTPSIVSAAESDYERNLANAVELFAMLVADTEHGAHNTSLFQAWATRYGKAAFAAAALLEPIWSLPDVKTISFAQALDAATSRARGIAAQIGFDIHP